MRTLSRRDFIRVCAGCGLCAWASSFLASSVSAAQKKLNPSQTALSLASKEAAFWEALGDGAVRCTTCPHFCVRKHGEVTHCNTRVNKDGKLYTMTYGRPCLICEDPLAKNPLYHVAIGETAVGVATAGCNLTCKYCQNFDISQCGPLRTKNMDLSPQELVAKVKERGRRWLTFSYTEPAAYLEYALDAALLARKEGIKIAAATAGFICEKPLQELIRSTDAFSITFKGNTEEFYRGVCGCGAAEVKKTIAAIARSGKWVEIAVLLVPGLNDNTEDIKDMMRFLAEQNRNMPVHFLRFAPSFKLANLAPTPVKTLETAHAIARREGLKYVYIDLPGHEASNTYCHGCGEMLVERAGFTIVKNRLKNGACPRCSQRLPAPA